MNCVLIYIGFVMPMTTWIHANVQRENAMWLLKKAIAERAGILLPEAEGGKTEKRKNVPQDF